MAEIAAQATEQGTVLLTVTSDTGQQGQAELSIEVAEDLKAQLETALLAARVRHIEATLATATTAGTFMPQKGFPERSVPDAPPPSKRPWPLDPLRYRKHLPPPPYARPARACCRASSAGRLGAWGHGFAIFGLCRGKPSSTTFGSPVGSGPDRRSELALDLLEAAKVQQAVVVVQDIPDRPSAGTRRLGCLRERPPSCPCLLAQGFKRHGRRP